MEMTTKEFCDQLRIQATRLANGELEKVTIKDWDLEMALGGQASKINASYIRTIMNRSPDVKALGTVKVKRIKDDVDMPDSYEITLCREPKRKVLTSDDVARLEAAWRVKFVKHLLATQPRITDLKGEQLEGAAIALERFMAMIEEMAKGE